MVTPHTDEKVVNGELARALDARHPRWSVAAEQTKLLSSSRNKKLDVLVDPAEPGLLPLPIETKFGATSAVEADADGRIGEVLASSNVVVRRALAVRLPSSLRAATGQRLTDLVSDASTTYEWCVKSKNDPSDANEQPGRWPKTGWLSGNVDEFARFCELLLVDDVGLARAATQMDDTVHALAELLQRRTADWAKLANAANVVGQEHNEQTARMVLTLLANAFLFERAIDGTVDPNTHQPLPVSSRSDTRAAVSKNWQTILNYNYWPIFQIAKQALDVGFSHRTAVAQHTGVIPQLVDLADDLARYGITATGDIAGQMFGKLITDRGYLATFYTLPSSAYLMAELVAGQLTRTRQMPTCLDDLDGFRVGDLACGTGALLTALYQRVAARIRSAGNDDEAAHAAFMETVIHAADVMPAAAHLTATLLASAHPQATFGDTNVMLMEYGNTSGAPVPTKDDVRVGSLEMLDPTHSPPNLLTPSSTPVAVTGTGERRASGNVSHGSLAACVMNPPFTSNTGDRDDSTAARPAFAGLANDESTQAAMKRRAESLSATRARALRSSRTHKPLKPARDGRSGLPTDFMDLADAKLSDTGALGLILPRSILSGSSGAKMRTLLMERYDDFVVVNIAASGNQDRAFSADTNMAECMLIARRTTERLKPSGRSVLWVNLTRRPRRIEEAVEVARSVNAAAVSATATPNGALRVGGDVVGHWASDTHLDGRYAGVDNLSVVETATKLADGVLALPRVSPVAIPMTTCGALGAAGPSHRRVGEPSTGNVEAPDAPLRVARADSRSQWEEFNYPVLWWHDHDHETCLTVLPDGDGSIKQVCGHASTRDCVPEDPACERQRRTTEAALALWGKHASRLHCSQHFQLNSQPLGFCVTPASTLGGNQWPTLKLRDDAWLSAAALWHNSTLGLLLRWLSGGRQQDGRNILTITQLPSLPSLDFQRLTATQLSAADAVYARFTEGDTKLTFRPANEAWHDEARHHLDRAVLEEVLGISWSTIESPLATLRQQWCAEPTVHGGQLSRPGSVGGDIALVLAREHLKQHSSEVAAPLRRQAFKSLSNARPTNPAAINHYNVALDELAALSEDTAQALAASIVVVATRDIDLARARAENARADDQADDSQSAVRWHHVIRQLQNVISRLNNLTTTT